MMAEVEGSINLSVKVVVEVLSEHLCEGWLRIRSRDAMACSPATRPSSTSSIDAQSTCKMAKGQQQDPAQAIASLNYLLIACLATGSQWLFPPGPGFIDHVANKKSDIVRIYLPLDATASCR
jgi:xylulose-5-phosphate/fructose-6-phosphate phosphoketolase